MPDDEVRFFAEEIIYYAVENIEFLTIMESLDGELGFDGLPPGSDTEAAAAQVSDAISRARVEIYWPEDETYE